MPCRVWPEFPLVDQVSGQLVAISFTCSKTQNSSRRHVIEKLSASLIHQLLTNSTQKAIKAEIQWSPYCSAEQTVGIPVHLLAIYKGIECRSNVAAFNRTAYCNVTSQVSSS